MCVLHIYSQQATAASSSYFSGVGDASTLQLQGRPHNLSKPNLARLNASPFAPNNLSRYNTAALQIDVVMGTWKEATPTCGRVGGVSYLPGACQAKSARAPGMQRCCCSGDPHLSYAVVFSNILSSMSSNPNTGHWGQKCSRHCSGSATSCVPTQQFRVTMDAYVKAVSKAFVPLQPPTTRRVPTHKIRKRMEKRSPAKTSSVDIDFPAPEPHSG